MKLLIIEDNAALADNLREVFEFEGYEVVVALDGQSGLAAAEQGFDLALVDVRLPDLTGTALVPHLKKLAPDAEAIIATANADLETAIEAVAAGAFAYLTKPVRTEELLLTVERALQGVELRRRAASLKTALESSERRLRTLVEQIDAVILTVTPEGSVRFASQATEHVLGWNPRELVGKDLVTTLAAPEDQARCRAMFHDLDGRSEVHEIDCLHADGSRRRLSWRWTKGHDETDPVYFGVGTDMTYRRALERRAMLAEKLALAGTLTAGLAHEIRNPLNAAGLQLDVLRRLIDRGAEPEKLHSPIDMVRDELRRLDGLLQDFLAFARPRELVLDPMCLADLVRQVVEMHAESARSAGRLLTMNVEARPRIRGEADALRQVLVNLINNAIDASSSRVTVRVFSNSDVAHILVEDDGPKIPNDVLDRLFEPFFTTKPTGTGLGMAIAHTIVEGHQGRIAMTSSDDNGTVVDVELPLLD